jgi:hypothetical protein
MPDKLSDIAMHCGVAKLDAELSTIKHRRGGPEWADLQSASLANLSVTERLHDYITNTQASYRRQAMSPITVTRG